jgi:hypothetical protein
LRLTRLHSSQIFEVPSTSGVFPRIYRREQVDKVVALSGRMVVSYVEKKAAVGGWKEQVQLVA